MIKKLLLIGSIAFFASLNAQDSNVTLGTANSIEKTPIFSGSKAQVSKIASATVVDTLWYFYNKHFYRNPASTGFFTLKNAATYTSATSINAGGGVFQNSGTMLVTGAEAVVARQASSPSATVDVGLFLYNVTGGIPTGAPLASVTAVITGTGGSFIGADFPLPVVVTGDYAIMMKNVSTTPGDTIRMFINNALNSTSTSTVTARKYGEGLSVVGFGPSSYTTTSNLFGPGSDYEFLVAPRVGYSVTASASAPTGSCTNIAYTFTNTSSPWIGHRQYNLNQFAVQWAPFANTSSVNIQPDPVYVWNFGDGSLSTVTNGTVMTVTKTFTNPGTFTGTLTANIQKMSDYFNSKLTDVATWTKTYANCNVGIKVNGSATTLNFYPNPTSNGKATISGLEGTSTIIVYNMLGQEVSTITTNKEITTIDLSTQAVGNYFIKISNSNNEIKTIKVINN